MIFHRCAQFFNNAGVIEDDTNEADETEPNTIPSSTKEVKEAVHIRRRFVQCLESYTNFKLQYDYGKND